MFKSIIYVIILEEWSEHKKVKHDYSLFLLFRFLLKYMVVERFYLFVPSNIMVLSTKFHPNWWGWMKEPQYCVMNIHKLYSKISPQTFYILRSNFVLGLQIMIYFSISQIKSLHTYSEYLDDNFPKITFTFKGSNIPLLSGTRS